MTYSSYMSDCNAVLDKVERWEENGERKKQSDRRHTDHEVVPDASRYKKTIQSIEEFS